MASSFFQQRTLVRLVVSIVLASFFFDGAAALVNKRHAALRARSKVCPNRTFKSLQVPVAAAPVIANVAPIPTAGGSNGCFPSAGFQMPAQVPSSTDNWWCDPSTEYAFVGFSYPVQNCQSRDQMRREFTDIRKNFKGRYVRLYAACDRAGFYDDVVEAAWDAGIGVHALIWFGWDDPNIWKKRRDALFKTLHSNPKAKFVTRVVQFGSEPLYDSALPAAELASQVRTAKGNLQSLGVPVTVSELAYGYQKSGGAGDVLKAIDFVDAHTLPFFSPSASTANNAWPSVESDLKWYQAHAGKKKIYMSQNGWPSITYPGVTSSSPNAVANVEQEAAYFRLLDSKCSFFKNAPNGGIGWFAHVYSESQAPGYGIYGSNGKLKFDFKPRSSC